jgi:hypothetical protein
MGRWRDGIAAARASLEAARSFSHPAMELSALCSLGPALLGAGEVDEASSVLEEAAELGTDSDSRLMLDRIHAHRAEAEARRGRLGEAELALEACAELLALEPLPTSLAFLARSRGIIRAASGDEDGAREALESARAQFAQLDIQFEAARCDLLLATMVDSVAAAGHRRHAEASLDLLGIEVPVEELERPIAPRSLATGRR